MTDRAFKDADPALAAYYHSAVFEFGFASMCKMSVPPNLQGMRILDIGCRRGRGVFKLSDRVGETGHVIGVDWSDEFIAEARHRSERAWRETGLSSSNMEFHVGYPEDLGAVGIGDDSLDIVFVNSVVNLAYDYERAFREMYRVLLPGGLLICETVLADRDRDSEIVREARSLGNNVQSAPSKAGFEGLIARIGFEAPTYLDAHLVEKDAGFKHTYKAPVASGDDGALFVACVAHIRKPKR